MKTKHEVNFEASPGPAIGQVVVTWNSEYFKETKCKQALIGYYSQTEADSNIKNTEVFDPCQISTLTLDIDGFDRQYLSLLIPDKNGCWRGVVDGYARLQKTSCFVSSGLQITTDTKIEGNPTIDVRWALPQQFIESVQFRYGVIEVTGAESTPKRYFVDLADVNHWVQFYKNGEHTVTLYILDESKSKSEWKKQLLNTHGSHYFHYWVESIEGVISFASMKVIVPPGTLAEKPKKGIAKQLFRGTEFMFGKVQDQCQLRWKLLVAFVAWGLIATPFTYLVLAPILTLYYIIIRAAYWIVGYEMKDFLDELGDIWIISRWSGNFPNKFPKRYHYYEKHERSGKKRWIWIRSITLSFIGVWLIQFAYSVISNNAFIRNIAFWVLIGVYLFLLGFWIMNTIRTKPDQASELELQTKKMQRVAFLTQRVSVKAQENGEQSLGFWYFVRNTFWKAKVAVCRPFEQ